MRRIVAIGGAVGILFIGIIFGAGLFNASLVGKRPIAGALAPDFELPLYADYRANFGPNLHLETLRGRIVVMNFWASWCPPCRDEAPELEATWRTYKDRGVVVVGVDLLDTETDALNYLKAFGITYPNGLDVQQRISKNVYRITGQPETFVVDRHGIIRRVFILPIDKQQLSTVLDSLLAEP